MAAATKDRGSLLNVLIISVVSLSRSSLSFLALYQNFILLERYGFEVGVFILSYPSGPMASGMTNYAGNESWSQWKQEVSWFDVTLVNMAYWWKLWDKLAGRYLLSNLEPFKVCSVQMLSKGGLWYHKCALAVLTSPPRGALDLADSDLSVKYSDMGMKG